MTKKEQSRNEGAQADETEYKAFVREHYVSFMNSYMTRYPSTTREEAYMAFRKFYNHSKRMGMSSWSM